MQIDEKQTRTIWIKLPGMLTAHPQILYDWQRL
jgi:hypothetical protein